jgi:WD40 repeat protein
MVSELSADLKKLFCAAVERDQPHLVRFDTGTRKIEIASPVPPRAIRVMALSPDEKLLATGGTDQTVRLWDAATLRELAVWPAHNAALASLAFSSDGAVLASAGEDRVIRLWDLPLIRAELAKLNLDW